MPQLTSEIEPTEQKTAPSASETTSAGGFLGGVLARGGNIIRSGSERRQQIAGTLGSVLLKAATTVDPSIGDQLKTGTHDSLTGLLNKRAFLGHLEADLQKGKQVGLLFIDLNNFKRVNDEISHVAGDEILKGFAGYLQNHVRETDELGYGGVSSQDERYRIGRFGGDEFWIKVNASGRDGVTHAEGIKLVTERIKAGIPGFIDGLPDAQRLRDELGFDVAVGAVIPRPGESVDSLIERASTEMKHYKAALKQ